MTSLKAYVLTPASNHLVRDYQQHALFIMLYYHSTTKISGVIFDVLLSMPIDRKQKTPGTCYE